MRWQTIQILDLQKQNNTKHYKTIKIFFYKKALSSNAKSYKTMYNIKEDN